MGKGKMVRGCNILKFYSAVMFLMSSFSVVEKIYFLNISVVVKVILSIHILCKRDIFHSCQAQLNGRCAQSRPLKGFPRKTGGKRWDGGAAEVGGFDKTFNLH